MSHGLAPFVPHPFIKSGHLQTIIPALVYRRRAYQGERLHYVDLAAGDKLVVLENEATVPMAAGERTAAVLVHGLGSSSHEPALVRHARRLQANGYDVFRMNHRGIAEGRDLSRGVYHADRMGDIAKTIEYVVSERNVKRVVLIAYSMSANMALKLLGSGVVQGWPYLKHIVKALCICPAVDMHASARVISHSFGGLYNRRFLTSILRYLEKRCLHFPDAPRIDRKLVKTIIDLDDHYISSEAGYADRRSYYDNAGPSRWLHQIETETHVLCAEDDPVAPNTPELIRRYPNIHACITPTGGHLGYLSRKPGSLEIWPWLDDYVVSVL